MIAALMLGRKGSTGFPGKNTLSVLGRPLCTYPMLAAKFARHVGRTYVSTDDEVIMEIAREHGAEVIVRPPELATNDALGEDAFTHGYRLIHERLADHGERLELLVLMMCNAATILAETIDQGIEVLRSHPEVDSAVTVSKYNMWSPLRARRVNDKGLLEPFVPFETFGNPQNLNCDRDSQGDVWFADMGASIVRPHCLEHIKEGLLPQKWMGRRIYPIIQWGGCDIDYDWQVAGVEHWLRTNGFTENSIPYKGTEQDSRHGTNNT